MDYLQLGNTVSHESNYVYLESVVYKITKKKKKRIEINGLFALVKSIPRYETLRWDNISFFNFIKQ